MDNVTISITEAPVTVTVIVNECATANLVTAENDFIIGSAALAWVTKTLAQVKVILGLTDYVPHSLATAANDFIVASGAGVFVKKTLAETKAILNPGFQNVDADFPVTDLDATIYKDFYVHDAIGNDMTLNLNNAISGDAGMIELIIDIGGAGVALGTMFTKCIGGALVVTLAADNVISWRKVGTDIIYTIAQVA